MANVIGGLIQILQIRFDLLGFTMSFQDIILTLLLGSILVALIGGLFK